MFALLVVVAAFPANDTKFLGFLADRKSIDQFYKEIFP